MVDKRKVEKISASQAECIMWSREPLGLFYLKIDDVYVGIDNSNGNAWTEEFPNLRKCKRWLLNEWVLGPSLEEGM